MMTSLRTFRGADSYFSYYRVTLVNSLLLPKKTHLCVVCVIVATFCADIATSFPWWSSERVFRHVGGIPLTVAGRHLFGGRGRPTGQSAVENTRTTV